jgi:single-strand DNA-binding protein
MPRPRGFPLSASRVAAGCPFLEGFMPTFNSVVLLGHLSRDPELRYTPQGAAVCDFSLAVNRRYSRKDGEKVDEVAFVEITVWNRLAELAAEYLKKGRAVLASGRLVQDRWEDQATGQKRSKLRVVAESLQFLGGGGSKDAETPLAESAPAEEPAAPEPLVVPDPDSVPAAPAKPAPAAAAPKGRPAARR